MYRSALGDFESAKAEQFYIDVLRRMTPDQKWQAACELWQMAVDTARAGVAMDHPDWTAAQVRAEVTRRIMEMNGAARILRWRYSKEQFRRRRRKQISGRPVWMLAPEDVILSKLLWYQLSPSERQLDDCIGVWKVQKDALDVEYLRRWAERLSVAHLLQKVTAA